jgi:hypothetical protein
MILTEGALVKRPEVAGKAGSDKPSEQLANQGIPLQLVMGANVPYDGR